MIGFYYVFLNNSLEIKSLEIVKNFSVYKRNLGEAERNTKRSKRKKIFKLRKEDTNKTKSNENDNKCNEQKVQQNIYSTNNDMKNTNVENQSNISISNINYNDMSKQLTEKELLDVLNSLKECPSKEDLRNIWNHTVGVAKGGLDDIQRELKGLIQKYLDNDTYRHDIMGREEYLYNNIWQQNLSSLCTTVGSEVVENTNRFFSLINGEHTLDDILKFIYSFLEHFETLKKELHEKHQSELLQKIGQNMKKKKK
ncbi:Plasmodium exported protein (PHISTa), unknown function [Plasmodium sp. gorilla clade G2]|uniref:Plasmodium exported protein (PHISTa), unknown function n=1 Tax=Plasmodium sp. gorilla clade G2 TaxID=880535 RepID=UPI000D2A9B9B|nr:Plasmodium exported protein (PHISTa), unknown function [Plasmodium sp. gorilla clade G2]SOV20005.1 Plasmodium exported protein (PHISTa), unknown function [Plasmodium sp. gorilla clade G2]